MVSTALLACANVAGFEAGGLELLGQTTTANGYAPSSIPCPSVLPTVRAASGLSSQEKSWLALRRNNTLPALVDVLERANLTGFNATAYLRGAADNDTMLPKIGIAVSGGGYRALMNSAGALAAFDSRTPNATGPGQLGGLLQAATYLSGLSGGSWLVGSLYQQNFTSVASILSATEGSLSQLWQFNESILDGPETLSTTKYYRQLFDSVEAKEDAGFNTSITDYWGRALSYQLFNATDGGGGDGYTFSSVANDTEFASAQAPMPILVAVERSPGQLAILGNSTVFEFNPWEMGSYDPGAAAFAPLRFVGSAFENGTLPSGSQCMGNVDNVGFVVGTSSSLFNQAFLQISKVEGVPDFLINAINATLARLSGGEEDIASWPNPFYHYGTAHNLNANSTVLTLVDGGEDLQNIPLHPLTLSYREVDVIIAVDSSADTASHWPNGTAMVATYQRSATFPSTNSAGFPFVPDQNTFINLGLNTRPTFFGCNADNMTNLGPLVVYLPNSPYSFLSNVSTFDLEYTNEERDQIVQNGYNVATMGNASADPAWPACLGCAVLSRSLNRTQTQPPAICLDCFSRYCWDGTVNATAPAPYEPTPAIAQPSPSSSPSSSSGGRRSSPAVVGYAAAMLCVLLIMTQGSSEIRVGATQRR